MGFSFNSQAPDIIGEFITVSSAADFNGYNQQYLRRMLRKGFFKTRKIGQIWLIEQRDFNNYLQGDYQA